MELNEHLKQYLDDIGLSYEDESRTSFIDALLDAAVSKNLNEKLIGNSANASEASQQLRLAKALESMSEEGWRIQ